MAKQVSPILLQGTLGGINYYFREDEPLARRAGGGFNRKAIKESPNMETERKSNSEFADCSKVNKAFKLALQPYLSGYRDGTFHSRLMQLFLKIKDSDLLSEKGKRTVHEGIAVSAGKQLLKDFVFTPGCTGLAGGNCDFHRDTLAFEVRGFKVCDARFPKEADSMKVKASLLRFDFESLAYEQVLADPVVIAHDFKEDSFEITCHEVPGGSGILFAVVRVSFYRAINGEQYLLSGSENFGVSVVSVWDKEY